MGLTAHLRAQVGLAIVGVLVISTFVGARSAQAFPPDQLTRGEDVWTRVCAECHGPDSTNLDAPLLLRPDSLRRFPNAVAAHAYVTENMPAETPGSLTPEEYWDVLAFLLAQSGVGAGETPLGPETAATMPTRGQGSTRTPGAASPVPAVASPEVPASDVPAGEPATDPNTEPAAPTEGEATGKSEGQPAPAQTP